MNFKMFAIFDEKAKAFLPPFVLPETGQAVRAFTDCVNSPDHQFGKHPADYTLFQVAVWSSLAGYPTLMERGIELVVNGVQVKASAPVSPSQLKLVEPQEA